MLGGISYWSGLTEASNWNPEFLWFLWTLLQLNASKAFWIRYIRRISLGDICFEYLWHYINIISKSILKTAQFFKNILPKQIWQLACAKRKKRERTAAHKSSMPHWTWLYLLIGRVLMDTENIRTINFTRRRVNSKSPDIKTIGWKTHQQAKCTCKSTGR